MNNEDTGLPLNGYDMPAEATPEEKGEIYRNAIMAALPGMTGAIDQALRDAMGHPVAFVLVTFGPGGASFTSNIPDAAEMRHALHGTVVGMMEEAATAEAATKGLQ